MLRLAFPRRRAAEMAVRGGLALSVAVVGYCSSAFSFAQFVAERDVVRAHSLAPYDGAITARLAASLIDAEATDADRSRADRLAKQALGQDPTAVTAAAILGLNAQARGDSVQARRIFSYAEMLSRRNLATQLWAIEDAVARDDIPAALRHYDITLRTTPKASEALYPILAPASTDPAIREALIRTLVARPPWLSDFTNYLATNGPDPKGTAQLFTELNRRGIRVREFANANVISKLFTSGNTDPAWNYYALVRGVIDRRKSRDPNFTSTVDTPSLFDWILPENNLTIASIQRGERGGVFDFSDPANVGGTLLQQSQMLVPGDYQITGHSSGIDQAGDAHLYWSVRCLDNHEIAKIIVPDSRNKDGHFTGHFTVPQHCPAQTLFLVARPTNSTQGISGQIDSVQLEPTR